MERNCSCHQVPMVFKGGNWRCHVKHREAERRYDTSVKGLARKRRYGRVADRTRVYVGKRAIRMLTQERKDAANALIKRKLNELESRFKARAQVESPSQSTVQTETELRED
jgi:hypothetical protein